MAEIFEAGSAGLRAWQGYMRYQNIHKLIEEIQRLEGKQVNLQGDANNAANNTIGNKSGLRDVTSAIEKQIKGQEDFAKAQTDEKNAKTDTGLDLFKMLINPTDAFKQLGDGDSDSFEQLEMPEFNYGGAIAGNGAASNMTNSGDDAVAELAKKYGVKTNGVGETKLSEPRESTPYYKSGVSANPEFNKDVDSYVDRGKAPVRDFTTKAKPATGLIGSNFTPSKVPEPAKKHVGTVDNLPSKVQPPVPEVPQTIGTNFSHKALSMQSSLEEPQPGPSGIQSSSSRNFWENAHGFSSNDFSPRSFTT